MMHRGGYALDDLLFKKRVEELVQEYGIKVIVETGVNEGKSTAEFAAMVGTVVAIDNDPLCLNDCSLRVKNSGRTNVLFFLGSSEGVLKEIASQLPDETIYFLDAHWGEYCPILDEIRALRKGVGIIILHDMEVPGRSNLTTFSCNRGNVLNYAYVKEALTEWSPTHRVEYNAESLGTNSPGIGYIFPK